MSRAATLESILDALVAEGAIDTAQAEAGAALIERHHDAQPWYVRTMVGVGAWLASLLLIGFVAGFSLAVGGSTLVGLALIVAALLVRRRAGGDNDFLVQATLAVSLAGQALFSWSLVEFVDGEFELGCVNVIVVSGILFFLFPDRVHRVLMILFAAGAVVVLAYANDLEAIVPVIGPLFAAGLVVVDARWPALIATGHGHLLRPLASGLALAAFGCLLLSTIYVLPELTDGYRFYPRPWLSTLLLAPLLLYVGDRYLAGRRGDGVASPILVYGLILAVCAAAWAMPGLTLALIVMLLGAGSGNRMFAGLSIAFFAVFLLTWFYGVEVTLLVKSVTLAASGAVVLAARALLLRVQAGGGT